MNVPVLNKKNNLASGVIGTLEEQYISLRKKEQRLYSDEEVIELPEIHPEHIHYKEWQIRKRSCKKLVSYLNKKNKSLKILEIGCGNGWLSAKLATVSHSLVTGQDINLTELKQAIKLFGQKSNLSFLYGDIQDIIDSCSFDIIVFASSIQYFSSLSHILQTAISLLKEGGEIHIIDSPFYKDDKIENAVDRSINYYASLGFSNMSQYYFHHKESELKNFNNRFLCKRNSILKKIFNKQTYFPWIRIIKQSE